MTSFVFALLLLSSQQKLPSSKAAEEHATSFIRSEFERIGRRAPAPDVSLNQAAHALAQRAWSRGAKQAGDLLSISLAVSAAGAFDPSPRAVLIHGPKTEALRTLRARTDFPKDPATHLGVGSVEDEHSLSLVMLFSDRKARMSSFPRVVSPGALQELCGELEAPLTRAEVYVTRPTGAVDRIPLSRQRPPRFCAKISFSKRGRHHVEVIGRGPRGPEVAVLFHVEAGAADANELVERPPEPHSAEDARQEILSRINALRRAHQAPLLSLDAALSDIATAYSTRMLEEGFFAHVDPQGRDLKSRLRDAHIEYQSAGENLGMADGPLAAHFGIELSPGHRKNLLEEGYSLLGIGIASRTVDGRPQTILTEILSRPIVHEVHPQLSTYRGIARQRAAAGLTPLATHTKLEALAMEHVQRLMKADNPEAAEENDSIHERVFRSLGARTAAVDVFIADHPGQVPKSQNLQDNRNRLVGVAAVRGQSPRYGLGRYWVVIIYASSGS
jgi:uncharacterized protein YkwD